MIHKVVCYYRVSTSQQGHSGLGLEAQRSAVAQYLEAHNGQWEIAGEFTEIESGKGRVERPQLEAALKAARCYKAALIVSKVDRLTRSVAFLSRLLEANVDVRFADLPQIEGATGRFMLQQMASVAELEAGLISDRTRKALAAAKARGQKLGGVRYREGVCVTGITPAMTQAAIRVRQARSDARAAEIAETVRNLQENGCESLRGLAKALTVAGIPTAKGGLK